MFTQRCPWVSKPTARPRGIISWKALMAAGAALFVVMVYVSCAFSDDSETFEVIVGPELRDCDVMGPMKCMVVNGEVFMGVIQGFDYTEGYDYLIKVERFDAWTDRQEPPHDAMRYGYRLIEVISKNRRM